MITGIDAARWQGKLQDARELLAAGIRFVIHKAVHGLSSSPDPEFVHNFRKVGECPELVRGAYLWFTDSHPVLQADNYARIVFAAGYRDSDLPLAIDFEEPGTKYRGNELLDRLRLCIQRVRFLTNRPVIVYTGRWYWLQFVGVDAPDLVESVLLWHSQYPRLKIPNILACGLQPPAIPEPTLPPPWAARGRKAFLFQWDGDGGCKLPNGVDADFNRFDGTIEQLRTICALRLSPPLPSEPVATSPETPQSKSAPPIADLSIDSPATPLRAGEGEHTIALDDDPLEAE